LPRETKKVNMARQKTTVEVDFGQLLDDISYTNKVTKTFDVSDIITRQQYYALKDFIITWLLTNQYTTYTVDGAEYVTDRNGDRIQLVKLTLCHGDKQCKVHQTSTSKLRKIIGLSDNTPSTEEYLQEPYDDVKYDETDFVTALSRMKVNRLRFMREMFDNNTFEQSLALNRRSGNPWMKCYLSFLPLKGKTGIKIVDKN